MKIILDENGRCIADVNIEQEARKAVENNEDFHVANEAAFTGMRAVLSQMPVEQRPDIEWNVYGKTVIFDNNLQSFDAWRDKRTSIIEDFLYILLGWNNTKEKE